MKGHLSAGLVHFLKMVAAAVNVDLLQVIEEKERFNLAPYSH